MDGPDEAPRPPSKAGRLLLAVVVVLAAAVGGWRLRRSGPIREEEALAFARRVEETVGRGDGAFFDSRFDKSAFIRKVVSTDAQADRLRDVKYRELGREIVGELAGPGAAMSLLRLRHHDDGQLTVLFRTASAGFGYYEVALVRGEDGGVSYDDVLAFTNGVGLVEHMRGAQDPLVAVVGQLDVEGRPQEGLARLDRETRPLPRSLVILLRVRLARQVGGLALGEAALQVEALTREDPTFGMVGFALHVERGEYEKALADVDATDRAVGGDPFLDAVRARLELLLGRVDAAIVHAEAAARACPELRLPSEVLREARQAVSASRRR